MAATGVHTPEAVWHTAVVPVYVGPLSYRAQGKIPRPR
jgi:hypothetical protein